MRFKKCLREYHVIECTTVLMFFKIFADFEYGISDFSPFINLNDCVFLTICLNLRCFLFESHVIVFIRFIFDLFFYHFHLTLFLIFHSFNSYFYLRLLILSVNSYYHYVLSQ